MNTMTTLYDQDFSLWLLKQAECIKNGLWRDVDRDHLAEEIEAMSRSEKRELINRLAVLMAHLLKWGCQSKRRSNSWISTMIEQRAQLEQVLEDSPSLRPQIQDALARAYRLAVAMASKETKRPSTQFPEQCPYSLAQLFDENFFGE